MKKRTKHWLIAGMGFFLACSLAYPQSLVELAEKEKARRAKLKDKKSIVLTNDDLKKISKETALQSTNIPNVEAGQKEPNTPESKASAQSPEVKVSVSEKQSSESAGSAPPEITLKEELKNTEEIVGVLTLKMRSLWQEFYSMDDMTPRDVIQKEISETFQQLQEARTKANDLRKKLNLPPLEEEEGAIFIKLNPA
jgi:hypothetical protein